MGYAMFPSQYKIENFRSRLPDSKSRAPLLDYISPRSQDIKTKLQVKYSNDVDKHYEVWGEWEIEENSTGDFKLLMEEVRLNMASKWI